MRSPRATPSGLVFAVLALGACGDSSRQGDLVQPADTNSLDTSADGVEDTAGPNDTELDTAPDQDTTSPADTGVVDTRVDTSLDVVSSGGPGDPCTRDADCQGDSPKCLDLPGGYCAPSCASSACPSDSVCYTFEDGAKRCLASCQGHADCRIGEGHLCDTDQTCWWYEGVSPGTSPIGGPCKADDDCKDAGATCYEEGFDGGANGFIGGYCIIFDCTPTSCPDGGRCITVSSDGGTACMADCGGGRQCPQSAGYACSAQSQACWPGCTQDSDCPDGYGCYPEIEACAKGYSSTPFQCLDQRFEPNQTRLTAADIDAPSTTTGLDLCAADEDWFHVDAPRATLTTVGIAFPHLGGDLDLIAYDEDGTLLGSRLGPESYSANARGYENGLEYHAILDMRAAVAGYFRVKPFSGATNRYDLSVSTTAWKDGPLCTTDFGFDECRGYNGLSTGIVYHFPFARADDPYVPSGYTLESYSNYRWLRRELIMLVRHAIHEVQQKFPGTTSLGLIDMGDKDAVTPGFDVGDPRHPESTHDQGGNIDIAYYQTDGSNNGQIVCGPRENANNDGYYCTSTAGHVVDLPRTAYFMAVLNLHPRLRVIGVDQMLAPLITEAAKKLRDDGAITAAQYTSLVNKLAYGDGWPFHHHHMHVSMRWWGSDAAQPNGLVAFPELPVGCGYRLPGDGPWPRTKHP